LPAEHALNFAFEIRGSFLESFAGDKPHEPSHANVLTDLSNKVRDQLFDAEIGILHEGLVVETGFFIKRFEFSLGDLFDDVLGLAGGSRLIFIDLFPSEDLRPSLHRAGPSAD